MSRRHNNSGLVLEDYGDGISSSGVAELQAISETRTVARTYRLSGELLDAFEKQVELMNTTQTNLMNEILEQYLYWARFIINHDSPFLTFDSGTIASLIENTSEEKLERIVNEISAESALDFIKFRWTNVIFWSITQFLDFLSSYANIGNISITQNEGNNGGINGNRGRNNGESHRNNGTNGSRRYQVAVRHHFGRKWSTMLALYIASLFTKGLKESKASFEISNNSCFVYLSVPK